MSFINTDLTKIAEKYSSEKHNTGTGFRYSQRKKPELRI